jgi:hypothetical protein
MPGFGQETLSGRTVKELEPQLILELGYVLADGSLSDIALLGSLRKALGVGGRKEEIQLA